MFKFLPCLVVLFATPVFAASFDCAKAAHPLEKTICGNAELSKLDEEMAAAYREQMALIFDKNSMRAQQANWQKILRTHCAKTCSAPEVMKQYRDQLTTLKSLTDEIYVANYKTNDASTLQLTHLNKDEFAFTLTRDYVDGGEKLCALPARDGDAGPIARMSSPTKAQWSEGTCTLDFLFKREAKGSVVALATEASDGCNRYCTDKGFTLTDSNYIPENYWVAGNQ